MGINGYGLDVAIDIITIMLTIGGIAMGIGFALNDRKLKEFGKEELFQSIINGILVGSLMLLFLPNGAITTSINDITISNGTSLSCQGSMSQNYAICFAYDYLSGSGYTLNGIYHQSILVQTTGLMIGFLSLSTILGVVGGFTVSLPIISISFSSAINPIISQIQLFVKVLTTVSISTLVQSSLLIFIAASAVTIILPIGIILRTFYPTRKVGGFLIALSIGLYVIFPLSYVLDANILSSYSSNASNSTITKLSGSAGTVENQILSVNSRSSISIITSISNAIYSIGSAFSSFTNSIIELIAYFIIAAFILPTFSVMITIISIKELSQLLGSEISFGLFDRV